MAKNGSKISTLEILVSIFVVIFVFSLIGIINLKTVTEPIESSISGEEVSEEVSTSTVGGVVVESVEVVEPGSLAQDVTGPTASESGTTLSPAWSNFEVMP